MRCWWCAPSRYWRYTPGAIARGCCWWWAAMARHDMIEICRMRLWRCLIAYHTSRCWSFIDAITRYFVVCALRAFRLRFASWWRSRFISLLMSRRLFRCLRSDVYVFTFAIVDILPCFARPCCWVTSSRFSCLPDAMLMLIYAWYYTLFRAIFLCYFSPLIYISMLVSYATFALFDSVDFAILSPPRDAMTPLCRCPCCSLLCRHAYLRHASCYFRLRRLCLFCRVCCWYLLAISSDVADCFICCPYMLSAALMLPWYYAPMLCWFPRSDAMRFVRYMRVVLLYARAFCLLRRIRYYVAYMSLCVMPVVRCLMPSMPLMMPAQTRSC